MESKLTLSIPTTKLRYLLENQVQCLFDCGGIDKYLAINGSATVLRLADDPFLAHKLPHIKMGYQVWSGMAAADRLAVLDKFHKLYTALPAESTGPQKAFVFCAVFIYELVAIIADAVQWPD